MLAPPPPPPSAEVVQRQRVVVIAGHRHDAATIRRYLEDPEPSVRAAALSALHRSGDCRAGDIRVAFGDRSPQVRARAGELSITVDGVDPEPLLHDADASVVEVACFCCGEVAWRDAQAPVAALSAIAIGHDDPLCRESAAAALGAIGDPDGLEAVLTACGDRVTVRRRATLALAAFDDPRADAALRAALDDNDWQVRQAAEDLLEVGRLLDAPEDPDAYAD